MHLTPVTTYLRFQPPLSLRVFEFTFYNSTSETPRLKDSKKHQQHDIFGAVVAGVMCIARYVFFPCVFAVLVVLAAPPEESVTGIVSGLQKRYAAVTTVTAQFQQMYRAPGVDQVESGVLWMKKPGLMRWEYRDPETKLFVADGHDTYLYMPEERQVMVRRFSAAEMHGTPLQFLLGQGNIAASFEVSLEAGLKPRLQGTVLLRLVPRAPELDYGFVALELDAKTYDVRRIVIGERTGNTSEYLLTNLETNVKVDDKQFRFKIPKGVEVIHLDEKD
jgi:outer membrane lipoprotein carrier protein